MCAMYSFVDQCAMPNVYMEATKLINVDVSDAKVVI